MSAVLLIFQLRISYSHWDEQDWEGTKSGSEIGSDTEPFYRGTYGSAIGLCISLILKIYTNRGLRAAIVDCREMENRT